MYDIHYTFCRNTQEFRTWTKNKKQKNKVNVIKFNR